MVVVCAGYYYNRIWVITAGCVLWGIMTAGFATTHSVAQVGARPRTSMPYADAPGTLRLLTCLHR